jgi:hypothetical protein
VNNKDFKIYHEGYLDACKYIFSRLSYNALIKFKIKEGVWKNE